MKPLSAREMRNAMMMIISTLFYVTCIIPTVLSLLFTGSPVQEVLLLGYPFMLALVILIVAHFALRDS